MTISAYGWNGPDIRRLLLLRLLLLRRTLADAERKQAPAAEKKQAAYGT